jgi:hypothetical protein
MNIKKYSFLIGPVILAYILYKINLAGLLEIFSSIKPIYVLVAIAVLALHLLVTTIRWKKIIDALKIKTTLKDTIIMFTKGSALGVVTPGRLGELYRCRYLQKKSGASLGLALSSTIIDRLLDIIILLILSSISALILVHRYAVNISVIALVAFLLLIIFFTTIATRKNIMRVILKPFFRMFVPDNLKERLKFHFNEFYDGLRLITLRTYFFCAAYTILIWILNALAFYFLSESLALNVPLWFITLALPILSIVNLLPISVSGIGTNQAACILIFSLRGINSESAVALSLLLIGILMFMRALPGIIFYIIKK